MDPPCKLHRSSSLLTLGFPSVSPKGGHSRLTKGGHWTPFRHGLVETWWTRMETTSRTSTSMDVDVRRLLEDGEASYEEREDGTWKDGVGTLRRLAASLRSSRARGGDPTLEDVLSGRTDARTAIEDAEENLKERETKAVGAFCASVDELEALHGRLRECDVALSAMEDVLGGFQQSLGNLSSEIRQLQSQSHIMSVQLRNRRLAEAQLADFLKHTAVPPAMVGEITGKGDVGSDTFAAQLRSLHGKLEFVKGDPRAGRAAALGDVEPELEKLRIKAVSRVRDYLMHKFSTLRKPKTNFQIIQQNVLRKHIDLIRFLQEHGGEVFGEVHASYVDTMSKVYMAHFHNYTAALMRLLKETAGPQTLLAGEEHRGAFSGLFTSVGKGSPAMPGIVATDNSNAPEAYQIGARGEILNELDAPPRIPHVAEAKKEKLPYEEVFRCMQKLLMETSTSEFVFCTDFFGETKTYSKVFAGATSIVEENITAAMPSLHDPMTLLLVIRVNSQHQNVMLDRSLHCLDTHFDRVAMLAWPRLKAVFDAHLVSLRQAQGSALATKHPEPHLISKRFAELAKSIFMLNTKFEDAQIDHSMDRISAGVCSVLLRIAGTFKVKRMQMVFLVNNYDAILGVLRSASTNGSVEQKNDALLKMIEYYEELLKTNTDVVVEDILMGRFAGLISYVKKVEKSNNLESTKGAKADEAEAQRLLADFSKVWKQSIDAVYREVVATFQEPTGYTVLKSVFTQFLLYYTRFLDTLKRGSSSSQELAKKAVMIPSIMYEIKRYSQALE